MLFLGGENSLPTETKTTAATKATLAPTAPVAPIQRENRYCRAARVIIAAGEGEGIDPINLSMQADLSESAERYCLDAYGRGVPVPLADHQLRRSSQPPSIWTLSTTGRVRWRAEALAATNIGSTGNPCYRERLQRQQIEPEYPRNHYLPDELDVSSELASFDCLASPCSSP